MRLNRKRQRHTFEAGGARFFSDRNFAGIGVGGDVAAACREGRGNNWAFDLMRSVLTGWDGVLDDATGKPLDFLPSLIEDIPTAIGAEIATQIIDEYQKEADRTEKELGESESGAGS